MMHKNCTAHQMNPTKPFQTVWLSMGVCRTALMSAATYLLASLIFSTAGSARTFKIPEGQDVVGSIHSYVVTAGDNLTTIAKQNGIGIHELLEANPGIQPRKLQPGQSITMPEQFVLPPKAVRQGIVVNISELRLYYFTPDGTTVYTYPVGLGRKGWRTPTTKTTVINKREHPTWYVPKSIAADVKRKTGRILPKSIGPGPDNPLGPRAIYLGSSGYLIHGTNQPNSVGKLVSSGCVRMYNDDVIELFTHIEKGMPVHIVHFPHKAGWLNGMLYLESHPPVSSNEPISDLNHTTSDYVIQHQSYGRSVVIDWEEVRHIDQQDTGIPLPVGHDEAEIASLPNDASQTNYIPPNNREHLFKHA